MSEAVAMDTHKKYEPMLEEIAAAFKVTFPDETLKTVEYSREDGREVFTISSDKKNRTYLRESGQSFEDVLRTIPELPPDKNP